MVEACDNSFSRAMLALQRFDLRHLQATAFRSGWRLVSRASGSVLHWLLATVKPLDMMMGVGFQPLTARDLGAINLVNG